MPQLTRKARWLALLVALVVLLWLTGDASACPNCKEALANQDGNGTRVAEGFAYSILFMMSMPFLLLGTGAFFVMRAVRRGAFPEM